VKKELIILSVLMVIALFVISGCSSGDAIKGVKKDVSLKTSEPVKIVRNQSFCNDTDFGIEPFVHGLVFSFNGTYNDSCKNSHAVTEYYCDGDEPRSTYIDCENLSPNGICQGGICINGSSNNQTNVTCFDSDYGDEFYIKGYRVHNDPNHYGAGIEREDYCILNPDIGTSGHAIANEVNMVYNCTGNEDCHVIEFHCMPNLSDAHTSLECSNGCIDGACINNGTTPYNSSVVNNTIKPTR